MFLPISAVAFTIGYSVFVASIMIETIYSQLAPPPPDPAAPASNPDGNADG
jgi:hypothetical protein